MKACIVCKLEKLPDGFYAHPAMADKRMGICKACHQQRMRMNRLTNPKVQERDRIRYQRPERKALGILSARQWRQNHPEAYKAQTALNNAVRDKRIKRCPCAMCGATKNIHGHHKNYNRPLDVIWLCAKCHNRLHATFPELGGHFPEATP